MIKSNLKTKFNEYIDLVMTHDLSTGLYNHEVDDIYHSSYGAMSEAVEKFILPLNYEKNFSRLSELKVLDICFGIGYNTKALLNEILKYSPPDSSCKKIHVDALEYDRNLVVISPFIKDGFSDFEASYLLLSNLKKEFIESRNEIVEFLMDEKNHPFLSEDMLTFIQNFYNSKGDYDPQVEFNSFLHNIYYHYVSTRIKTTANPLEMLDFTFKPYFDDARESIKKLSPGYDIVFLDAFTPIKLPTLWSVEFFSVLYNLMNENSMLVTYSNSAAVRNGLFDAGFYVGKTFDKNNRPSGTTASKNISLISSPLDDYDLGLLKTNAGVVFHDKNLDSSKEEILKERDLRKLKLNLESSSSYIKRYSKRKAIHV